MDKSRFATCKKKVDALSSLTMNQYSYRVIIEPDEKNTFHAYVPALPGCHTWGKTFEDVQMNIRDAMDAYLRSLIADGEEVPEDRGVEMIEHVSLPVVRRKPFAHAEVAGRQRP